MACWRFPVEGRRPEEVRRGGSEDREAGAERTRGPRREMIPRKASSTQSYGWAGFLYNPWPFSRHGLPAVARALRDPASGPLPRQGALPSSLSQRRAAAHKLFPAFVSGRNGSSDLLGQPCLLGPPRLLGAAAARALSFPLLPHPGENPVGRRPGGQTSSRTRWFPTPRALITGSGILGSDASAGRGADGFAGVAPRTAGRRSSPPWQLDGRRDQNCGEDAGEELSWYFFSQLFPVVRNMKGGGWLCTGRSDSPGHRAVCRRAEVICFPQRHSKDPYSHSAKGHGPCYLVKWYSSLAVARVPVG